MSKKADSAKSKKSDKKKGGKVESTEKVNEEKKNSVGETDFLEKKDKRSLRFHIPEKAPSVEEYESAMSILEDAEEEIIIHPPTPMRKFILSPMRHSRPRTIVPRPCFSTLSSDLLFMNESMFLSPASSSKQLFEVLRNSPTPSDADLNLINAAYLGRLNEVKEAIESGADVNTFRDRQTPLLIATENGDFQLVKYLLKVPKININFQNVFGQTPLFIAVRNCLYSVVNLLLNYKAKVNISDNMGRSPLHEALFRKRPKVVKILLAYGADCNTEDSLGERPIYTSAVKKPDLECLTLLIKAGASVEYTNYSGISLLSRAILCWTPFEIIQTLIQSGASVNSPDLNSWKTPLHFAAIINDLKIAQYLVNEGARVNVKSSYNYTPYQEAVFHRSLEVAEFLAPLTDNANLKCLSDLKQFRIFKGK